MARGRYIVLEESCPSSEIPSMMGRIVQNVRLPLYRFAPVEPLDPKAPRHNPQDILPTILPQPDLSTTRKDVVDHVHDRGIRLGLTSFFGIDLSRSHTERIDLESAQVKRYALKQPNDVFTALLANPLYAHDARALLDASPRGKGYMVTGFMTTTGSVWALTTTRKSSASFTATVPVSILTATPSLLDPSITPKHTITTSAERTMTVRDEEIFAIAYCTVRLKTFFDRTAPHSFGQRITFAGMRRAKGSEPALGPEADSGEEEIVDDDEESDEEEYEFGNGSVVGLKKGDVNLGGDGEGEGVLLELV